MFSNLVRARLGCTPKGNSGAKLHILAFQCSTQLSAMIKTRLRSARALKSDGVDPESAAPDTKRSARAPKSEPPADSLPPKPRVKTHKRKSAPKPTRAEHTKAPENVTEAKPAGDSKNDAPQEPSSSKATTDPHAPKKKVTASRSRPLKIEYSEGPLHDTGDRSPYFAWEPENWKQVLDNVRKMRQETEAPVDTMGCDKCPDHSLPDKVVRFQLLVSLMLSSQTKDEVTHAAVGRLREFALTPESVAAADEKHIEELIYPVSFYKNKAKHLKRTAQMLLEQYDGDIPDSVEGLCNLPGVGPKMAYLAMSCGWGRTVGIGVDTHVHRIANRLGWLPTPTKTPEQTRKGLEAWLPRDLWDEVNHLLVGFGQTVCKPVGPKCSSCLNSELCPFGRTQGKAKSSKQ